jgi:hypothetical protein
MRACAFFGRGGAAVGRFVGEMQTSKVFETLEVFDVEKGT